ncbi:MAG: hypothetical protein M1822_004040 [Bathelium mastoideum]|nr:MAG: hypothetical protein M1822_004040 [Bathelium mastoideum]
MSTTHGLTEAQSTVVLHSKSYAIPKTPTVVVCVDGFDPEYLEKGIADGLMPNCKKFVETGFHTTANVVMPSLTNPNNTSIITGVPTAVHGISGYFLDRETGKEVMVVDVSLLQGSTILAEMSKQGVRVAAVTAKDKLRRLIHHGLENGICFSSQFAAKCTLAENGIENVESWIGRPTPSQYSADLSLYVLDAGVKLLEENRADLFYLTLSDYVQHKYAPREPEADEFLAVLDERLGKLVSLGAVVAVTGDHGMSSKSNDDGSPNVLFLQDELESRFGDGCARVICPIADPFPKHHSALGSFVRVYVRQTSDIPAMIDFCKSFPQAELVLTGAEAATKFEMPLDREGDFVVVSVGNAVIGAKKAEHDLTQLGNHKLRSHGGLSEQPVPLIMSRPVRDLEAASRKAWRNFDAFDLALNW